MCIHRIISHILFPELSFMAIAIIKTVFANYTNLVLFADRFHLTIFYYLISMNFFFIIDYYLLYIIINYLHRIH